MKKLLFALFSLALLLSCTSETAVIHRGNPNLINYHFSTDIDTRLEKYVALKSLNKPIYLGSSTAGWGGVFVMKVSDTGYVAWESNCPNHLFPESCYMHVKNLKAICGCDDMEYSLLNGTGPGKYPMKPYAIEILDTNVIRVYN